MVTENTNATARRNLGMDLSTACMSVRVNVQSTNGSALDLFRLRTAANGPIIRTQIDDDGNLMIRNDVGSGTMNSLTPLPSGWNEVELCGTVGAATTWDLYLNGGKVVDSWATDTGSTGVGRIQIGDPTNKTITANWDDVVVDSAAG